MANTRMGHEDKAITKIPKCRLYGQKWWHFSSPGMEDFLVWCAGWLVGSFPSALLTASRRVAAAGNLQWRNRRCGVLESFNTPPSPSFLYLHNVCSLPIPTMAPPFRAEQIGSLLRPAELLAARASSDVSKSYVSVLPEEVKRVTREAIASAVKKQESLSIRPLTSGEYERHIFYGGFFENLEGMKILPELPIPKGFRANLPSVATLQKQGVKTRPGVVATGKIQHVKCVYGEEWEVLRSLMKEGQWRECKLTMPSPTWQHMQ